MNVLVRLEPDADGDSLGDETQDSDDDNDGVPDSADNCKGTASGDAGDLDGDGQGDPCDADDDGDGLPDAVESALGTNPRAADSDGDGRADGLDACSTLAAATTNGCPGIDTEVPGVALAGFPSRLARRALVSRGVRGTATPSEPAALEARLVGTLKGARITRAGDVVLAEQRLRSAAGRRRITLRVQRRLRRRLSRRLRLRLEVVATDPAGNRGVVSRRITVR